MSIWITPFNYILSLAVTKADQQRKSNVNSYVQGFTKLIVGVVAQDLACDALWSTAKNKMQSCPKKKSQYILFSTQQYVQNKEINYF